MGKDRYITIQEWMLAYNLKPAELMAFALIFGFSQDGRSTYRGSYDYLAHWLNVSHPTICSILQTLTERGLVEKIETPKNGAVKLCEYRVSRELKNLIRTNKEILPVTSKKSLLNNKNDNKERKESSLSLQELMQRYG